MTISGGTDTGAAILTPIDPALPNLTGKDLMQKPYMLLSGTNDTISNTDGDLLLVNGGTPVYHDAVLKPFGVCPNPAYAVIMAGANHLTPVGGFGVWPSWDLGVPWAWLQTWLPTLGGFFSCPENPQTEKDALLANNSALRDSVEDFLSTVFHDYSTAQGPEEARLQEFEQYTLAFWDVHLSPRYDIVNSDDYGSRFLGLGELTHEGRDYVDDDNGFRYSAPSPHAFSVRNSAGIPLVQFQEDGNVLILQGTVSEQQTSLVGEPNVPEFLIKNSTGNVLTRVSAVSGGLSLRGGAGVNNQSQSNLAPGSGPEFIIKNSAGDAQIIIDASGNLKTRRRVYTSAGAYPATP